MNFKSNLTRSRVRQVLLARRGEVQRLAERLGKTPTAISLVLKGKSTSAKILAAATERAAELAAEDAA